jgi:hypothetical protein
MTRELTRLPRNVQDRLGCRSTLKVSHGHHADALSSLGCRAGARNEKVFSTVWRLPLPLTCEIAASFPTATISTAECVVRHEVLRRMNMAMGATAALVEFRKEPAAIEANQEAFADGGKVARSAAWKHCWLRPIRGDSRVSVPKRW